MNRKVPLRLVQGLFAVAVAFTGSKAMAQYTDEWIVCTDGRSPDACRATQIPADPDTGIVFWGRSLGSTLCVGVGIVPQDTDCTFRGSSYNGFGCFRVQDTFGARVPAGNDMAIACGDIGPLDDGPYSAQATSSSCFTDVAICGNFWIYSG